MAINAAADWFCPGFYAQIVYESGNTWIPYGPAITAATAAGYIFPQIDYDFLPGWLLRVGIGEYNLVSSKKESCQAGDVTYKIAATATGA
jgi:hypothetical protein